MSPEIDLRPCPFCGGPAEATDTGGEHLVGCGRKNVCPVYAVAGPYQTAEEAAAAWNRRGGLGPQVPFTQADADAVYNRPLAPTRNT